MASEMQAKKKKLDAIFSTYIRLKYSDINGYVSCVTCPYIENKKRQNARRYYRDKMQNGHYMDRNRMNTRFHEMNCHPQCVDCNLFTKPKEMILAYNKFMIDTYGAKKTLEIEQLGQKTELMSPLERELWYDEMIPYYNDLVKKLKANKMLTE